MAKAKPPVAKKDIKKPLKGVVVKKKIKPPAVHSLKTPTEGNDKVQDSSKDDDAQRDAKRRKIDS